METSMSTQSVQLETKLLSQISSQFQHMMSVLVQNNQVAAPIPECHTDNMFRLEGFITETSKL